MITRRLVLLSLLLVALAVPLWARTRPGESFMLWMHGAATAMRPTACRVMTRADGERFLTRCRAAAAREAGERAPVAPMPLPSAGFLGQGASFATELCLAANGWDGKPAAELPRELLAAADAADKEAQ